MVTVHKCCDTGLFGHLSNSAFSSLLFQKEITSEAELFFQCIANMMQIPERQKKTEEILFDFEIHAFELVA